jgi:hypothetical protein
MLVCVIHAVHLFTTLARFVRRAASGPSPPSRLHLVSATRERTAVARQLRQRRQCARCHYHGTRRAWKNLSCRPLASKVRWLAETTVKKASEWQNFRATRKALGAAGPECVCARVFERGRGGWNSAVYSLCTALAGVGRFLRNVRSRQSKNFRVINNPVKDDSRRLPWSQISANTQGTRQRAFKDPPTAAQLDTGAQSHSSAMGVACRQSE